MEYTKMITADEIRKRLECMNFEVLAKKVAEEMKELDFLRIINIDQKYNITALFVEYEDVQQKPVDVEKLKEAINLHAYSLEMDVEYDEDMEMTKSAYIYLSEEKKKQYREMLEEKVNNCISKFNKSNINSVLFPYNEWFDSRIVAYTFYTIANDAGFYARIIPVQKTQLHPIQSYHVVIDL